MPDASSMWKGTRSSPLLAFLVPVLLSLPGFIVASSFNLTIGWISSDFWLLAVALCLASTVLQRSTAYLFIGLLFLADLALYLPPGVSVADVFETGIKSAHSISPWKLFTGACVFCVVGVVCLHIVRRTANQQIPRRPLVIFFAALLVAIAIQGALFLVGNDHRFLRSAMLSSARLAWKEPKTLLIKLSLKKEKLKAIEGLSSVQKYLRSDGKFILVLVESWGVPVGSAKSRLRNEAESFREGRNCAREVTLDTVKAPNYTIHSEVRQLCSAEMSAFTADFGQLQCAPSRREGLTSAYHNNDLGFYHRDRVYKDMGFKRILGREEMGLPSGAGIPFGAATDAAVAEYVAQSAEREPGFHYWMTLDMHSPYDSKSRAKPDGSNIENYWRLREGTMRSLRVLTERLPEYELVFVGDHAPKFFGSDDAGFIRDSVPLLHLSPCLLHSAAGAQVPSAHLASGS